MADGVTIKIARVGGIGAGGAAARRGVELGLPVTVEDTGGSDIDTAAMAHASLSTPAAQRIHTVDFNAWVTVWNADGMPSRAGGARRACRAGLGVDGSHRRSRRAVRGRY